jgi:hypothetical protein
LREVEAANFGYEIKTANGGNARRKMPLIAGSNIQFREA